MMHKSKIKELLPEQKPNNEQKAGELPSAQVLPNPMLGDVYRRVLNFFLSTDDFRPAMKQPFIIDEFVFATDASKLICFKKSLLNEIDFESHPKAPNALVVIKPNNVNIEFDIIGLRRVIEMSNDAFNKKYKVEETECPDCNGSGFVDYVFEDRKRKKHEIEEECPTCENETDFTIITEIATGNEFEIVKEVLKYNDTYFDANNFATMVETAELLNVSKISIVSKDGDLSTHKFQVGECVICLVPIQIVEDWDVVTNIA